jgi:flagellum-specific peptidoglycan hydrolase FlgJ
MKHKINITNALLIFVGIFLFLQSGRLFLQREKEKTPISTPDIETITVQPQQMSFVPTAAKRLTNTEQYIKRFKSVAVQEMKRYGIPASITLAQGILESASGNSELSRLHNNHFGIKCKSSSQKCANYADDKPTDQFRVFKSAWYSYREHSILLSSSSRYASLFKLKKTDYKRWARGLQRAGYATSKNYGRSLIKIIERYNLQKFDRVVTTQDLK